MASRTIDFTCSSPPVKNQQKKGWVILVSPTQNTIYTLESPTPHLIHKKINNFLSKFLRILQQLTPLLIIAEVNVLIISNIINQKHQQQ